MEGHCFSKPNLTNECDQPKLFVDFACMVPIRKLHHYPPLNFRPCCVTVAVRRPLAGLGLLKPVSCAARIKLMARGHRGQRIQAYECLSSRNRHRQRSPRARLRCPGRQQNQLQAYRPSPTTQCTRIILFPAGSNARNGSCASCYGSTSGSSSATCHGLRESSHFFLGHKAYGTITRYGTSFPRSAALPPPAPCAVSSQGWGC